MIGIDENQKIYNVSKLINSINSPTRTKFYIIGNFSVISKKVFSIDDYHISITNDEDERWIQNIEIYLTGRPFKTCVFPIVRSSEHCSTYWCLSKLQHVYWFNNVIVFND